MDMAEFLLQQGVQIIRGQLAEECIQTRREGCDGKPGGLRTELQSELSERVAGIEPALRQVAESGDQTLRWTPCQILVAIAFQGVARLGNHCRVQRCARRKIGQKIVRQVHSNCGSRMAAGDKPTVSLPASFSRARIACRQGNPTSERTSSSESKP